jgi:FkbM family methyltransferase
MTTPRSLGYSSGGALLRLLLRFRRLTAPVTWAAKVWLRHARLERHLGMANYDGVIDGGANIGEFAQLVRLARRDLPIVCVEPHRDSARILRRKGFHVVEAALWSGPGRLTLSQPTDASTSCTVVTAPPGAPTWQVDAIRLGDIEIAGDHLLIKLDLQGAEREALEGMGSLWPRCRAIIVEVSYGQSGTYEDLREFLQSRGFFESATFNELDGPAGAIEADKLFERRDFARGTPDPRQEAAARVEEGFAGPPGARNTRTLPDA